MKNLLIIFTLLFLLAGSMVSCKKEDAADIINNAVGTTNELSAKIDDVVYKPLTLTTKDLGLTKQILAVGTPNISLTLLTTTPGTYNFLSLSPKFLLSYIDPALGTTALTMTSGSLTITSYDASTTLMKGTFEGTLVSSGLVTKNITAGTFSVTFK